MPLRDSAFRLHDIILHLRNLLAHEYFGVSIPIIWQTVVRDLPPELDLPTWMRERSRSRSAGANNSRQFPSKFASIGLPRLTPASALA